jgi:hypothetical protein
VFSALAVTSTTESLTLAGMPVAGAPSTPAAFGPERLRRRRVGLCRCAGDNHQQDGGNATKRRTFVSERY